MYESRISSRKLCRDVHAGIAVLRAFDVLGPRIGRRRERQVAVRAAGEGQVLDAGISDVDRGRAGVADELRGFRRRVGDVHRRGERDGVSVHRRHFLDLGERPARATVPRQPPGQRQVPSLPRIPNRPDDAIGGEDLRRSSRRSAAARPSTSPWCSRPHRASRTAPARTRRRSATVTDIAPCTASAVRFTAVVSSMWGQRDGPTMRICSCSAL